MDTLKGKQIMVWTFMGNARMYEALRDYGDRISQIGLFSFKVRATGEIYESGVAISDMLTYINRWPHIKWLLTVANDGANSIFRALRDNTDGAQDRFLSEIVRIMEKYPWCDGIDIDLERGDGYSTHTESTAMFCNIYNTVKAYDPAKHMNICLPGMTSVNGSVGGENWCVYGDLDAYCRVSTGSDAQLESLDAQKTHYENYINGREDWDFAGLYFDEGISGTKKEKRPALLQMIADCKAGKIDFVITKSISRFARNTTDCLEMVRKLLELDIPIYFEKENLNTSSMESELFLAILSSMAEGESTSISENNKWSIQRRFKNGTFKLSYPPYGYDWDGEQMVINPEQAETVRWIFKQVLSGKGTHAISDELNANSIPTKKGGRWTPTTVRGMVSNEKYTGDVIFQKTYTDSQFNRHINYGQKDRYAMSDHHEAIISREVFEAANALIAQRGKEKGIIKGSEKYQSRYCFSGRIVCGECGDTFKRRIHSTTTHKYAAWCCNTHIEDKSRCSIKYIRDDTVKAAFVTMINKLIFAHSIVLKPYVETLQNGCTNAPMRRIQQIQTLLLENAEQRETLTKLMAQGYIDQILYNEENNTLLSQADRYRQEMDTLSKAIGGDGAHVTAAKELLRYVEKAAMLTDFDEALFENTVTCIKVLSREEIAFELKCGLTLKERM